MQRTIENPCYHCYAGAIGECAMTPCKYQFKSWSKDLDAEEINVEVEDADSD